MKETKDGLTIIYTGEGKGKTTAAMGLAVRAAGYGKKIAIIQFVKIWFTGEKAGFEKFGDQVEFIQAGKGFYQILDDRLAPEEHVEAAKHALEISREKVLDPKYDVVILDEIIGTIVGELLPLEDVLDLIDNKPPGLDLVLTGRYGETYPELMDRADLVTKMTKLKHPYDKGIMAKESIDF